MDKRYTFNEDPKNYDRWRPTYCKELFYDIIRYSELNEKKKAIEVGIGTGQATKPFLMTGCDVTAIELGTELAEFSKEKFKEYKNFQAFNTTFEEFECLNNSVDIIYSATAFHWIPEEIGYPKVMQMLKPGGTLALFWNRPFASREDDLLHQKIQSIYQKYRPSNNKIIENDAERYKKILETIQSYGFIDLEMKLYHNTRIFTANDYINLLNTYSDHRSMPGSVKLAFESEIKNAILENGNSLNIYDTMDLYLAKKQ